MAGVILDIGTGDGKFVYKLAQENPDKLVIGLDPNQAGLVETSAKVYKKPAKGGLENAMYVLAGVEELPEELEGVANQVFINFPWGSLLKAVVEVDEEVWRGIRKVCMKGAVVDLVFGYDTEHDAKEVERLGLPGLGEGYIRNEMLPRLRGLGFKMKELRGLGNEDIKDFPSSWAKRVGFGKEREYWYLRLVKGM